jgi:hypothetical protein
MTTPDYTQKMSELRSRVEQHVILPGKSDSKGGFGRSIASAIPKINTQSPIFYTIPPVVLIILFLFMKPGFVCEDNIDQDNVITQKMNYKKLLISGLIGGGVVSIGLFAYFRQKKS